MPRRVPWIALIAIAAAAAGCADEGGGTVVDTIGAGASQCGNGMVEDGEECDDDDDESCTAMCTFHVCGDGILASDEQCDDANDENGDACTSECVLGPAAAVDLALGAGHTCALSLNGRVKCWGAGGYGRLGQPGFDENIGDDEPPSDWDDVDVGGDVVALASGREHVCGLRSSGTMFCWGENDWRRLGYPHSDTIGDDETPAAGGDLALTGVEGMAGGEAHTCALTDNGDVTCWGNNGSGQLGYGDTASTTDMEEAGTRGAVPLPGPAAEITAGDNFTCARLESGDVHCWGRNAEGQLGTGAPDSVGDDETPDSVAAIDLGGKAVDIDAGAATVCAALEDGGVRCWGANRSGQLGNGDDKNVGDRKTPAEEGVVMFDGAAQSVEVGVSHACAVTADGQATCWGDSNQLGHANEDRERLPTAPVSLGIGMSKLEIGREHSCAITTAGRVRCWGSNGGGRLGIPEIGGSATVKDPADHGDVDVF